MLVRRVWVLVLVVAAVSLVAINAGRIRRLDYVSAQGGGPQPEDRGTLIVPERSSNSYEWLSQTRLMLATRAWRIRHIDYENAPFGRPVSTASPYRWWLGLLARVSGKGDLRGVDAAGIISDPLLHLLALVCATALTALWLGPWAACAIALAVAFLFPLGAAYLPGAPDDRGPACALALLSALTLLGAPAISRRAAATAGLLLGVVFWLNPGVAVPVLLGFAAGGVFSSWAGRGEPPIVDWRIWSGAGALMVIAAFLIEYAPSHLRTWQLREVHPVFALAWLGVGELVIRAEAVGRGWEAATSRKTIVRTVLALIAVASVPVVLWRTHDLGFIASDLPALRLARLPTVSSAATLFSWVRSQGLTAAGWAALLPVLWTIPALVLLVRSVPPPGGRRRLAIIVGVCVVAIAFACRELRTFDLAGALLAVLLALAAAGSAGMGRLLRAGALAAALLLLVPGLLQLLPAGEPTRAPLEEAEIYQLIERDLARWLVAHSDPNPAQAPIVLAPHALNATFHYDAGIRGLATLGWENRAGLEGAVRIASASTPEEAKELIDRRGISYLIIPSWDPYLDVYARMGMGQLEGTFLERVHAWRLPGWLRPVPYAMPAVAGLESQSVFVFQVVPDPGEAVALSRIAEYFVAIGQLGPAASVGNALRRYPASMAAWVARGEVAGARQDAEGLESAFQVLQPRLNAAPVRNLPWDLRVGLTMALAEAHHLDLAREPVRRCFAEANPERIRMLSERTLFRLLLLGKAFGVDFSSSQLHNQALALLPLELRQRL